MTVYIFRIVPNSFDCRSEVSGFGGGQVKLGFAGNFRCETRYSRNVTHLHQFGEGSVALQIGTSNREWNGFVKEQMHSYQFSPCWTDLPTLFTHMFLPIVGFRLDWVLKLHWGPNSFPVESRAQINWYKRTRTCTTILWIHILWIPWAICALVQIISHLPCTSRFQFPRPRLKTHITYCICDYVLCTFVSPIIFPMSHVAQCNYSSWQAIRNLLCNRLWSNGNKTLAAD